MSSGRLTSAVSDISPIERLPHRVVGRDPVAETARCCLELVAPDHRDDRPVLPVVAADEVRERRAVGVAARQGDEVVGRHAAVGLLARAAGACRSSSRGPSGRSAFARPEPNIGWNATPAM